MREQLLEPLEVLLKVVDLIEDVQYLIGGHPGQQLHKPLFCIFLHPDDQIPPNPKRPRPLLQGLGQLYNLYVSPMSLP